MDTRLADKFDHPQRVWSFLSVDMDVAYKNPSRHVIGGDSGDKITPNAFFVSVASTHMEKRAYVILRMRD